MYTCTWRFSAHSSALLVVRELGPSCRVEFLSALWLTGTWSSGRAPSLTNAPTNPWYLEFYASLVHNPRHPLATTNRLIAFVTGCWGYYMLYHLTQVVYKNKSCWRIIWSNRMIHQSAGFSPPNFPVDSHECVTCESCKMSVASFKWHASSISSNTCTMTKICPHPCTLVIALHQNSCTSTLDHFNPF